MSQLCSNNKKITLQALKDKHKVRQQAHQWKQTAEIQGNSDHRLLFQCSFSSLVTIIYVLLSTTNFLRSMQFTSLWSDSEHRSFSCWMQIIWHLTYCQIEVFLTERRYITVFLFFLFLLVFFFFLNNYFHVHDSKALLSLANQATMGYFGTGC